MKNIFYSLLFSFAIGAFAQNTKIIKGDKLNQKLAYIDAIKTYENIVKKGFVNHEICEKIGDAYYFNANYKIAAEWYQKAFSLSADLNPEYFYRYALTMKSIGQIEESDKYMVKYISLVPEQNRAQILKKENNYKEYIKQNSDRFELKTLSINSPNSDFGGSFYKDQLVFSTSRESKSIYKRTHSWTGLPFTSLYSGVITSDGLVSDAKKFAKAIDSKFNESTPVFTKDGNTVYFTSARNASKKVYGWTKEPFLDIYKADYNEDGTITNSAPVKELNTKYHDGSVTISKDGNTMYFTSDSFREDSFEKDKANKLKLGRNNIFKATKENGKWGAITSLPFNSSDYSTGNPSLSKDAKTLYFSSNMPGSIGGVDIWKVAVAENGSFGTPENLGKTINTEGNESFPFIADENVLYFSSDAKQGLGGMDVYKIDLKAGTEAKNVGKPVNSDKDDFSFSFNENKNFGFVASNRNGNDDIFGLVPVCVYEVNTIVTNSKTGAILADAKVSILDDKNNVITTEQSNAKGEVSYKVECEKNYTIQAAKDGFESNSFAVTKSNNKGGSTKVDAASVSYTHLTLPTNREV